MAPHVEKLIAEIRALPREDQETIVKVLTESHPDAVAAPLSEEQAADLAYQKQLLAAGLISEIRLRQRDQEAFDRYTPISITGEPLSETIIRERR
jgi:hypothetical protein